MPHLSRARTAQLAPSASARPGHCQFRRGRFVVVSRAGGLPMHLSRLFSVCDRCRRGRRPRSSRAVADGKSNPMRRPRSMQGLHGRAWQRQRQRPGMRLSTVIRGTARQRGSAAAARSSRRAIARRATTCMHAERRPRHLVHEEVRPGLGRHCNHGLHRPRRGRVPLRPAPSAAAHAPMRDLLRDHLLADGERQQRVLQLHRRVPERADGACATRSQADGQRDGSACV